MAQSYAISLPLNQEGFMDDIVESVIQKLKIKNIYLLLPILISVQ